MEGMTILTTPEERAEYKRKLEEEFREVCTGGIFSLKEVKEKEKRGIELLTKMIDHDILEELIDMGNNGNN